MAVTATAERGSPRRSCAAFGSDTAARQYCRLTGPFLLTFV